MADNHDRVNNLFRTHFRELIKYTNTLTHDEDKSEDLVSDVMLNLLENDKPEIHYDDTFNLRYIQRMLHSRFINGYRIGKRYEPMTDNIERLDDEYDYDDDIYKERMLDAYIETINETRSLRIDKYAALYIKARLYGMSIANVSSVGHRNKNTIYRHFKILDAWVNERFESKKKAIQLECGHIK